MLTEKQLAAYQAVIKKCREDAEYKKSFLASPEDVLEEAGFPVEEGVTYQVIEEPKQVKYIVLPKEKAKETLKACLPYLVGNEKESAKGILDAGFEVRLLQNTEDTHYCVLPVSQKTLSEEEWKQVTGGVAGLPRSLARISVDENILSHL